MSTNRQPRRRRRRAGIAALIGGAIAATLLHWFGFGPKVTSTQAAPATKNAQAASPSKTEFAFYSLALSLAPAFCEVSAQKKQCQKLTAQINQATPVTLHGLWPENRRPGSYPEDCGGASISVKMLEERINPTRLRTLMPGVEDGLASHEWRKHGSCSGLDALGYFSSALDWTERVNGALRGVLNAASAKQISAAGMRRAAEQIMPGLGSAMTLHCRNIKTSDTSMRGKPVLMEIRVCLSKNAQSLPDQLSECAALDRIDQGCGASFVVDGV
jgi:ribonuclease T2